jgi:isocitrate/isopropylmalate dehydrogenase
MKTYKIAAIPGDGIGKEVTAKDLDRVIVRENSEGEYAGHPWSGFRYHSKGVANPIGAFPFSLYACK